MYLPFFPYSPIIGIAASDLLLLLCLLLLLVMLAPRQEYTLLSNRVGEDCLLILNSTQPLGVLLL